MSYSRLLCILESRSSHHALWLSHGGYTDDSGPQHGHYVCLIRSKGRWVMCDDENVEPIQDSDIYRYFGDYPSGAGYVLFYQAAKLDREALGLKPEVEEVEEEEEEQKAETETITPQRNINGKPSPASASNLLDIAEDHEGAPEFQREASVASSWNPPSPSPSPFAQPTPFIQPRAKVASPPAVQSRFVENGSTPPASETTPTLATPPASASLASTSVAAKERSTTPAAAAAAAPAPAPVPAPAAAPAASTPSSTVYARQPSPAGTASSLPQATQTPFQAVGRSGTATPSSQDSNNRDGKWYQRRKSNIPRTDTEPSTLSNSIISETSSTSSFAAQTQSQLGLSSSGVGAGAGAGGGSGVGMPISNADQRNRTVSSSSQSSTSAFGTSTDKFTGGSSLSRRLSGMGKLSRSGSMSFGKLGFGKKDKGS